MKLKRIILLNRPKGVPTEKDFSLEEIIVRNLTPDEFLVEVDWLSLDPYMRGRMDDVRSYAKPVALGDAMEGEGVGRIVASKHHDFKVGQIVVGKFGWVSHSISTSKNVRKLKNSNLSNSTALGVLGMPGHTAWIGLNKIAMAKKGETILVSAATGAVGSLVGQLAKHKGMTVIGVAGNKGKCDFAVKEFGYDYCLNHSIEKGAIELRNQIKHVAPKGIDIYFENVGGKTLEAVVPSMNVDGRIAVCGMISWYSGQGLEFGLTLPKLWRTILVNRLKVQGFIIFDHKESFEEFDNEIRPLVLNGSIKYKESITLGLENAPKAFLGLLKGTNFGKQLIKI